MTPFLLVHLLFLPFVRAQSDCTDALERYVGYSIRPQRNAVLRPLNLPSPPITNVLPICRFSCNDSCSAFGLDLGMGQETECTLYDLSLPAAGEEFIENYLTPAHGESIFRKFCLGGGVPSCGNVSTWLYDVVPGWGMKLERATRVHHVPSMLKCQEACVSEAGFLCRSATFDRKSRNCYLSRFDRRSAPDAFTDSNNNFIYLENQCVTDIKSGCIYSSMEGIAPVYTWYAVRLVTSEAACRQGCEDRQSFICRGYTYDMTAHVCRMTSEDSFSVRSLPLVQGTPTVYNQRGECIQVTVTCGMDEMRAMFTLNREFRGKVFAVDSPDSCMFDVSGKFQFQIILSLIEPSVCSIQEQQPNVFSAMMMMQYHDMVRTGMDRMFNLMCIFDTQGMTVVNSVELKETTSSPSPAIVQGGVPLPEAYMRIVNGQGRTVTTAEIDQTLFAEVVLKDGSDRLVPEYGMFVTNCEAFSDSSRMTLVDGFGCPTDTSIFEGFSPAPGTGSRILRAAFGGFKFESENKVNLNCNVNFCFRFCEPALCTDRNGRRIQSYGRRKRSAVLRHQRILLSKYVHSQMIVDGFQRELITNVSASRSDPSVLRRPLVADWLPMVISLGAGAMACVAFALVGIFWGRWLSRRLGKLEIRDGSGLASAAVCLKGIRFFRRDAL